MAPAARVRPATTRRTVGPYAAVQLQSTDPTALTNWLTVNGYVIPADIQSVIAAHVMEGFDFLALRLRPGQGVQAMRPVRVTSPGAGLSLPLRMVAAGTGATVGITLWVIADGRYEPKNFPFFTILPSELTWDWSANISNYTTVQAQKEAAANNTAWQIESSLPIAPLVIEDLVSLAPNDYMSLPASGDAGMTVDSGTAADARNADLAALFPEGDNNVMQITRMRGDLAHAALTSDLVLQASTDQSVLSNIYSVAQSVNKPPTTCPFCPCAGSSSGTSSSGGVSSGANGSAGAGSSSGTGGTGTSSGSQTPSGAAPAGHGSSGCAAVTSEPEAAAIQLVIAGFVTISLVRARRTRGKGDRS